MTRTTILFITLVFALGASAGDDGALNLSPAVIMLHGEHGQSTTQTLTLTNGTSRKFSFDLVAQDVIAPEGERTFVEAGTIPGSIAATAIFSPKHVDVPPGESVAVRVTITLPPNTPQRAVLALFRGTNRIMSGNVPMLASLGTLLTFSVSNEIALTGTALQVRPQSKATNLGITQSCTNSGREPLVARGVIAVLDAKGALVGKSELKPHRLIPGESATLGGDYGDELRPGHYKVFITYDYDGGTLTRSAEVEIR